MSGTVVLTRAAAEEIRLALTRRGVVIQALDAALADHIQWSAARHLLAELRTHFDNPETVHNADQSAAAFVEYLAGFGVDLRDERVVFEFLTFLALLSSVSANSCDTGAISHEKHEGCLVIGRSVAAILTVLAPADALEAR